MTEHKISKGVARGVGSAVADFEMIREGDRVLVAMSGGKDSTVLAAALARLRDRSPVRFELAALTVDPTGGRLDLSGIAAFARSLGMEHEVVPHPIFDIIRETNAPSPCSFCANMRRGILAAAAVRLGCGSLALGHHSDDAIETLFLNMIFGGRLACFEPTMTMDRTNVRVIRPLIYLSEHAVAAQASKLGQPPLDMGCEHGASSKRAEVKAAIKGLGALAPDMRSSVARAIKTGLWQRDGAH